ncbi:hypothetical protein LTS18_014933 [Coniosporium uncinatum]|uniref:Uncharacterized protein n=1 Tax=Coniosporium uncinatum TaxID=93489 RepID=A0ACC3DVN1_9PEZI|nr:hypothetical protein LTS18_014933 [Coniosporium uncinatum]
MADPAPPASESYRGNCHCGAVIYEVTLSPPLYSPSSSPSSSSTEVYKVANCNCSICVKSGYLIAYPLRTNLRFLKGEAGMKSYHCASNTHAHRFCGECGGSVMIDLDREWSEKMGMGDSVALNVRLLHDIDVDKLSYNKFDGKKVIGPAYQAPEA